MSTVKTVSGLRREMLTQKQMQTKAEDSASHPPPRSGLVQLLSEPPKTTTITGRLIWLWLAP